MLESDKFMRSVSPAFSWRVLFGHILQCHNPELFLVKMMQMHHPTIQKDTLEYIFFR